jgi:hypothetical protein
MCLPFVACSEEATDDSDKPQPFNITIEGTVRNLFSGDAAAVTTASLQSSGLCASEVSVRVRFFDAIQIVAAPATAAPLGECVTASSDGKFKCENLDIANTNYGILAFLEDADTSIDCVAPSSAIALTCAGACKIEAKVADHVVDESELLPMSAIPSAIVAGWTQQLREDAAGYAQFGDLLDTGFVLGVTLGTDLKPKAGAQPYAPADCNVAGKSRECRQLIVTLAPGSGAPVLDPSLKKTTAVGMYVSQQTNHDEAGNPAPVPFDLASAANVAQAYSAIDCSGGAPTQCYQPVPTRAIRKDDRGAGTPGNIYLAFMPPIELDAKGACPVNTAATGTNGEAQLVCQ